MSSLAELSSALSDELEANDAAASARPYVDPRSIPTRFSLLKKMALSPAHYLEAVQQQDDDSLAARLGAAATDKKEALRFGTAVHQLLLGAADKVARFTGAQRRGKAWEAFQADADAKGCVVILNEREHAHARAIAEAVRNHKTAMRLLFDGTEVEKRIDWSWGGRDVRSTPDARGQTHIADLKTAQTADPVLFARAALRMHYHAQAAIYRRAIEIDGSSAPSDCYVIAVEKSRPYPVTVLRFTDQALLAGEKSARLWMERLRVCEAANVWPEYTAAIEPLDLPDESFGLEIDGQRFEF